MSAVNSPLLSRQRMSVEARGEMVRLTIGNAHVDMPYETAIQLSQWLRVRGKQARNTAGERAHWSQIVTGEMIAGNL